MFTDRFVKLPIKTFSQQLKELMDDPPLTDKIARIDPDEICEYFPVFEDDQDAVSVHLRSGHSVIVYLPMEEFEKRLNEFDK